MSSDEPESLAPKSTAPTPGPTADPPAVARLDARGLACPLPVLKARKHLGLLPPGAVLEVVASDPGSLADFRAFCDQTGDLLLSSEEREGLYHHRIRKAG